MTAPNPDLAGLWDAIRSLPPRAQGAGRAVMFMSARRGEGVSGLVRSATLAAGAGSVYAIDLDLRRNALVRAFVEHGDALGPRIDARLNGRLFYQMQKRDARPWPQREPTLFFHRIGRTRAYVSAFDVQKAPPGADLLISKGGEYWDAARAGGATVMVDAPALERSRIGLRVAPHMDGVVLVVGAEAGAAPAAKALRDDVVESGARVLGIVYTGASAPVMALHRLQLQVG